MQNQQVPAASMTGTIKWFNTEKGYGFVRPDDGSSDIFLHITALKRANLDNVPEGAAITFEMVEAQKGRQVSKVVTVDPSTAPAKTPQGAPRGRPNGG
ncbi:cold-shock protein [Ferruginivarius sediminum]|nr:cold shock domain-containing protein [Ferruginivarius sediminum]